MGLRVVAVMLLQYGFSPTISQASQRIGRGKCGSAIMTGMGEKTHDHRKPIALKIFRIPDIITLPEQPKVWVATATGS